MSYKSLLLKLKEKVNQKGSFHMEVVGSELRLSCCIFSFQDQMIPLPIQYYIDRKKDFNEAFEPYFQIQNNKIYLIQQIPLSQVVSCRQSFEKFSKNAQSYKNILNDLKDHSNSFSFL